MSKKLLLWLLVPPAIIVCIICLVVLFILAQFLPWWSTLIGCIIIGLVLLSIVLKRNSGAPGSETGLVGKHKSREGLL